MSTLRMLLLDGGGPVSKPLQPLRVRTYEHLGLADGTHFLIRGITSFNLLGLYLTQGPNAIRPVLAQLRVLKFNTVRYFTSYNIVNVGRLDPAEHPEFYPSQALLTRLLGSYGLYAAPVAYSGAPPTFDPQHWDRLGRSLQGEPNIACLSMVNEGSIGTNQLPSDPFYRVPGLLCSHGSNGSMNQPVLPVGDLTELHTNDAFEEQRKWGHDARDIALSYRAPCWTSETSRYPEVGMWSGASLDRCQQLAHDAAKASALLNAGFLWHSVSTKLSSLMVGDEVEVVRSLMAGVDEIDLACQDGNYTHLQSQEGPNDLRIYQRGDQIADIRR